MIRGLILAQRTRITPGIEKMEQTKKLIYWKLFTKTCTVYTFDAFLQSQANVHSKMQKLAKGFLVVTTPTPLINMNVYVDLT